jgi:hypothetical protein
MPSVTTSTDETLELFTWYRWSWLDNRKVRYHVLVWDCNTGKIDSLASPLQVCIPRSTRGSEWS